MSEFRIKNDALQVKINGRFKTIRNITDPHDVVECEYNPNSGMVKIVSQSLLDNPAVKNPWFCVEAYSRRTPRGGRNDNRQRGCRKAFMEKDG